MTTDSTASHQARRYDTLRFVPAETAIMDAVRAVEAMGGSEQLTDAVMLLMAARESVADHVDGLRSQRRATHYYPAGEQFAP